MTTPLRPYPAYKDSDIPGLVQIPSHWQIRRCGFLFAQRNDTGRGELPILEVSFNTGVRIRDFEGSARKQLMADREKYKRASTNDIAYNMMRLWQGAIGVVPTEGLVSPAYVVARPYQGTNSRYFVELLRTDTWKAEINRNSRGIVSDRNRLYWDQFKQILVVTPPEDEQAAIVRFLDHVGQKIRRFIQAKRRLIELLNEQKQSIINQAVTRGLDPDAPFRASGIDWLGDVPEHWEVCRLRNVVTNVTSGSRGWSSYAADEGPLFLRIANLRRNALELRFDDVVRLDLPETAEAQRTRVKAGDILISITAYIGSMAVVPSDFEEAYVSQHVARCRPRDGSHNPRWLGYVLLSLVGQTHGRLSLYGGTKDGLSLDDVKNYPLLLPPRSEQDRLVDWIEQGNSASDAAILRVEQEINLIREYRTRLVSDVVTGKLDVREAARDLPTDLSPIDIEDDSLGSDDQDPMDDEASELISAAADED